MIKYKINKEKCVGCGTCVSVCPEGVEIGKDGKAKVVDSKRLAEDGGKDICPFGAIEEIFDEKE